MRQIMSLSLAVLVTGVAWPARAQQDTDGDDGPGRPVTQITVIARRLDAARETIATVLGISVYTHSIASVESRPGGETTSTGSVLLQAPGITQDASGQLQAESRQFRGHACARRIVAAGWLVAMGVTPCRGDRGAQRRRSMSTSVGVGRSLSPRTLAVWTGSWQPAWPRRPHGLRAKHGRPRRFCAGCGEARRCSRRRAAS